MKSIGLDIGTTTICAVLIDTENGTLLDSITMENSASITTEQAFERLQDPAVILNACSNLISSFYSLHSDILSIGITGQMHGILYLNKEGIAISPLYTWQDRRGDEIHDSSLSYAEYISKVTGYQMATGYGFTTHFYNTVNHLVPTTAASLCTIADYIAMQLSGCTQPLLHKSMAASLGFYQLEKGIFSKEAFHKINLNTDILPMISTTDCTIGTTEQNIPISIAIGDNQASFLASADDDNACLVNVGTGSQISMCTDVLKEYSNVECRPYINGTYLIAGSSLCGGAAYARLKQFFKDTLSAFGVESDLLDYETMNRLASSIYSEESTLDIDTRFRGTRKEPSITGSIKNLNDTNFHPSHFILGVLKGISDELYQYYLEFDNISFQTHHLIGSGNGIRKNILLQKLFTDTFNQSVQIPVVEEEASFGSALFSLYATGYYTSLKEIQKRIQYLD